MGTSGARVRRSLVCVSCVHILLRLYVGCLFHRSFLGNGTVLYIIPCTIAVVSIDKITSAWKLEISSCTEPNFIWCIYNFVENYFVVAYFKKSFLAGICY